MHCFQAYDAFSAFNRGPAMTLVQLRHLIALAESGSFSRAAEATHLTQPALSRSIRALEDELGVPLFDRIGRRAELTPTGRETLERARQLILDAAEIEERAGAVAQGRLGKLRVGMGSGPGALLMTPLLVQAATGRPGWRVEVARGATAMLVQRLRARTLDALVVDIRSLEPAVDLELSQVAELRGAFMVRPGHALDRGKPLRFDALRPYPMASIPLSTEVSQLLVERYGPQAHPDLAVNLRCEEIASLVEVATHTDTVLLAIRASAPGLVELAMDPPLAVAARLGLVTLARRTPPAALDVLRELMAQHLVDRPRGTAPADAAARP
jgi:DNA-binding transcriptional LysR family regulator